MNADCFHIMVVDDSAVIRGLLTRTLEADPMLSVVASVGNGQLAINALERHTVDVIVLDIEMPVMDGLSALPQLLARAPAAKVVMASTLTRHNADITLRAMRAGAADYIPKPSSMRELQSAELFKQELLQKVRALAVEARKQSGSVMPRSSRFGQAQRASAPAEVPRAPVRLRNAIATTPRLIAIGSSTGGPQALFEVLKHLSGYRIPQPIMITQHMPATFTAILADHISRQCGLDCREGVDGEPLVSGRVYVAPGDHHMVLKNREGKMCIALNQDPPENYCRPSVDTMLRSAVDHYGHGVVAMILTGMGHDGLKGCRSLAEAGGSVLAQDEGSSVVWGMPGAVANAGLCTAVLPLRDLGPKLRRIALPHAA